MSTLAQFNQFDVACSRHCFGGTHADEDARVVFVGPIFHPLSVPGIGFGTGQRTARVDGRGLGKLRHWNLDDTRAGGRQANERRLEDVGDCWRQVVLEHRFGHRETQITQIGGRWNAIGFRGQDLIEQCAVGPRFSRSAPPNRA
jgi:hypothetical protein